MFCPLVSSRLFAVEPDEHPAAKFRLAKQAVRPLGDGSILAEAEEFRPASPGETSWRARPWGENYYVATFANCFLSRKAFLAAPEQADEAAATIEVEVPKAGRYLALVRYEAAFRFETQFRLRVEQNGQVKLNRLYGARKNPKIWAFSQKIKPEVEWSWGAVENIVWEGHDAYVQLAAGRARLTLIAAKQPQPAARRHVDLVMLTQDEAGVKQRIEKERYLPLDGLLTQEGDVFLKLHNQGAAGVTLTLPKCTEHSPYWVHQRNWKTKSVTAAAGKSSDWTEVGGLLDTMNDGQWNVSARGEGKAALKYTVEIGVKDAAGEIQSIAKFPAASSRLSLAYFGDTRYSRRMRTTDTVLYDLLAYLKKQPIRGKRPERTLIYGYTFAARPGDPKYTAARAEFIRLFNLATTDLERPGTAKLPRGYVDVRGSRDLEKTCQEYRQQGVADKIAVVSLGDEIGLGRPPANDHEGFRQWLKQQGLKPSDVVPSAGGDWKKVEYSAKPDSEKQPRLFYYCGRYRHHFGVARQKIRTDVLRKHLPNAGIGANYSPHHGHVYLGEVHKWIKLFRAGGMTMPWSEDYIWGVPVGSQQMNFLGLDMFRAAIKGQPKAKILYYVMPHFPGNTLDNWRRQFYGDLGHGMQIADLFEFRPLQAAYTENYVDLPEMYQEVRKAVYELGQFEDVIQEGRVRRGTAALWFSETADIWDDNSDPFAAAKRTLYVAIRHQQLPLDVVIEEDALAGDLRHYSVLYLSDRHVSRAASKKIAEWVAAGGRLLATAGAGMFDEFNRPNTELRRLLGVTPRPLETPDTARVKYAKQDLPFSKPLDTVTFRDGETKSEMPVIAARARFQPGPLATVLATFADGSPAVIERRAGKGNAFYCGFLPGLSYFQPAIPLRPVDRGTKDDSMAHFIPTEFDAGALAVVGLPARGVMRPVACSQPLVASSIVQSAAGAVIPLVNWSGKPIRDLKVTLNAKLPGRPRSLASGNRLQVETANNATVLTLDLEVADAVIVRP